MRIIKIIRAAINELNTVISSLIKLRGFLQELENELTPTTQSVAILPNFEFTDLTHTVRFGEQEATLSENGYILLKSCYEAKNNTLDYEDFCNDAYSESLDYDKLFDKCQTVINKTLFRLGTNLFVARKKSKILLTNRKKS